MARKGHYYRLKKSLGFWGLTLYGVGIILGAGIYTLIGIGAGVAGNAIWMSFVIAAMLAFFTGLSYAELSSMFSKDAAEYVFTKEAFKKDYVAFAVQWLMLFTVIVSGAAVALGFGGYFSHMFGGSVVTAAAWLAVLLSGISYVGMKESSEFNNVSTIIETAGLVIVAVLGLLFMSRGNIDYFALPPAGIGGILSGTALIFFAYLGFESMVNLSEETKNAKKTVPKALVTALAISTVLYILVALAAVNIVGAEKLSNSAAPLTEVVSATVPQASFAFSLIALFATANTVLIIMIVGSRMLYGLARQRRLPVQFGYTGKRRTPYVSIIVVMAVTLLLVMSNGIKFIALLTDAGIFIVYAAVNAALIWLRYKKPKAKRPFRSPLSAGKFPVLAGIGLASSIFMLLHFDYQIIFYEIAVVGAGLIVYQIYRRKSRKKSRKR